MYPFPYVSCTRSLYALFFSFSICEQYTPDQYFYQRLGAFGCITLMSKNVLPNDPQTPIPDASRRAFSALFPFLIKLLSSDMSSCSILTLLHTSCVVSASRSLIQIYYSCVSSSHNPPFFHESVTDVVLKPHINNN